MSRKEKIINGIAAAPFAIIGLAFAIVRDVSTVVADDCGSIIDGMRAWFKDIRK